MFCMNLFRDCVQCTDVAHGLRFCSCMPKCLQGRLMSWSNQETSYPDCIARPSVLLRSMNDFECSMSTAVVTGCRGDFRNGKTQAIGLRTRSSQRITEWSRFRDVREP